MPARSPYRPSSPRNARRAPTRPPRHRSRRRALLPGCLNSCSADRRTREGERERFVPRVLPPMPRPQSASPSRRPAHDARTAHCVHVGLRSSASRHAKRVPRLTLNWLRPVPAAFVTHWYRLHDELNRLDLNPQRLESPSRDRSRVSLRHAILCVHMLESAVRHHEIVVGSWTARCSRPGNTPCMRSRRVVGQLQPTLKSRRPRRSPEPRAAHVEAPQLRLPCTSVMRL